MERETGVEKVWNQRGWHYLKKLNYSWQSPRQKHKKCSLIEQEKFRKNLPLKVKEIEKKYPSVEIYLWFF
ncbi:winged helix-turn-helix domain-containing protein [Okeania sp. SIO3I5]|uniref:winged helix-turn-helix domain-containing protein n=1 Tax=Okeania sp. SIO3I5 TaxID=2607805 RepID=UPI003429A5A1